MVDAILLMGENVKSVHISEFSLYVGYSPDYTQNTPCSASPYIPADDPTYGRYYKKYTTFLQSTGSNWPNGVEAWCNLPGNYVTFVREADA